MWLKRNSFDDDAIFYWQQARQFFLAAQKLPLTSAPLTHYYCMLNATKTLLLVHNTSFSNYHGVTGETIKKKISLSNEKIILKEGGVLPALCSHLGEKVVKNETYTLKEIFYNLPFIHRAYTLTYKSEQDKELFIPIKSPCFVRKASSRESWFCFELEDDYASKHTVNKLPKNYEQDIGQKDKFVIRNKKRFTWDRSDSNKLQKLTNYHFKIRRNIYFISGFTRLWYIKRAGVDNIISRQSMPLIFCAMHRLSELSRYDPVTLSKHLNGQQNWLISEFISKATNQFLDEVSSEITGKELMMPGIAAESRE